MAALPSILKIRKRSIDLTQEIERRSLEITSGNLMVDVQSRSKQEVQAMAAWIDNIAKKTVSAESFSSDLDDGVAILQCLDRLDLASKLRYNKVCKSKFAKLENMDYLLKILDVRADIKFASIMPSELVDSEENANDSALLQILYAIFHRYIMLDGMSKENDPSAEHPLKGKSMYAKAKLRTWIAKTLNDENCPQEFKSFKDSFKDGVLLAYLLSAVAPGSIDVNALPETPAKTIELVVQAADDKINAIPMLDINLVAKGACPVEVLVIYLSFFMQKEKYDQIAKNKEDAINRSSVLETRRLKKRNQRKSLMQNDLAVLFPGTVEACDPIMEDDALEVGVKWCKVCERLCKSDKYKCAECHCLKKEHTSDIPSQAKIEEIKKKKMLKRGATKTNLNSNIKRRNNMIEGEIFQKYFEDGDKMVKHEVLVFFNQIEGLLCFNPPSMGLVVDKKRCMKIKKIRDLMMGSVVEFFSDVPLDLQKEKVLVIKTKKTQWAFRAPTTEIATAWLKGLSKEITNVQNTELQLVKGLNGQLNQKQKLKKMNKGYEVVSYMKIKRDGVSAYRKVALFVYLDSEDGEFGTIYWSPPHNKRKFANHSIPLSEVEDIIPNKQHKVFQNEVAKDAPFDTCFSIIGAKKSIHIQAPTVRKALMWMTGINTILGNKFDIKMAVSQMDVTHQPIYLAVSTGTPEELEVECKKEGVLQDHLNFCLSKSCAEHDLKKTVILLKHGANPNFVDSNSTPLHRVLLWADVVDVATLDPIIRVLVSKGADQEAKNGEDLTCKCYLDPGTLRKLESAFAETRSFDEILATYPDL